MTKKELLALLEDVPDNTVVYIWQDTDSSGGYRELECGQKESDKAGLFVCLYGED